MEELGTIRYGELLFNFNLTDEVFKFVKEKSISRDFFIMSSQSFYQAILFKLKLDHSVKTELEVMFYSMNSEGGEVNSEVPSDYEKFVDFPAQGFMLSFGVKLK